MLVTIDIEQKIIGNKPLFNDLQLSVEDGEKIAIIGRNGVGKTTLFRMLTGEDKDFAGSITYRNGVRVVATRQEHHDVSDQTVVDYILQNLPEYTELQHIIETFPATMGDNIAKITRYSEALERLGALDYYTVEDRVRRSLEDYQLGHTCDRPLSSLSGGQKRFVELVRVEHAGADLALIDEPTNHMDYVAKAAFLKWFAAVKHGVVVITHDRDLLQQVQRIIEVKDQRGFNFIGNYDAYLAQNAQRTASDLNEYDTVQRRIENIKKQIQNARAKKARWGGTADKKNPFVVIETKLLKELKELDSQEKPSFWIDQESVAEMRPKMEASYQKHKAKTIHIRRLTREERQRDLIHLDKVQVGYDGPLFEPVDARIETGDRLQIIGRNGAGKTTLVRAITEMATTGVRPAIMQHGRISCDTKLRINTYEQEIDHAYLTMTLAEAIEHIYDRFELKITAEQIMRILSDYLFDPYGDREQLVGSLSGGQKARLQLIKLFANEPNLVILDEPTNHLDLPSIEELEAALAQYKGSLLYISHDSYLAQHLGGKQLTIAPVQPL
ncbi:MAG TPA: ABC-F family ATP-binding cassette domain-containing protein [Candidatus Saccharimonadales bacterium]|jgi:ATPase subunit of ABC transporter with duplicated ATPase domains|nr:ABC-F family ATP-binding cassette domain-containing protein [Candidatus Saccharimonadales bacterium]